MLLLLLLINLSLFADLTKLLDPQHIHDLPYHVVDEGLVVIAEVAYADYEALRRDFAFLQGKTDVEINAILIRSFSVLSRSQLETEGIFFKPMEGYAVSEAKRIIRRPVDYNRAGILPFVMENGDQIGLLDTKGLGIRPKIYKSEIIIAAVKTLRGEILYDPKIIGKLLRLSMAEKLKLTKNSENEDASRVDQNSIKFARANAKINYTAFLFLLKCIDEMGQKNLSKQQLNKMAEQSLVLISRMDYVNGLMPLERSFKEIVTEKLLRRLYAEYNAEHSTDYSTVQNYAIIVPKLQIIYGSSVRRASFLLRKASPRRLQAGLSSPRVDSPNFINPVLGGGIQWDDFGRQIDFEVPSLTDLRVADLYGANGEFLESSLKGVTKSFESGNKDAFTEFLGSALQRLNGLPETKSEVLLSEINSVKFSKNLIDTILRKVARLLSEFTASHLKLRKSIFFSVEKQNEVLASIQLLKDMYAKVEISTDPNFLNLVAEIVMQTEDQLLYDLAHIFLADPQIFSDITEIAIKFKILNDAKILTIYINAVKIFNGKTSLTELEIRQIAISLHYDQLSAERRTHYYFRDNLSAMSKIDRSKILIHNSLFGLPATVGNYFLKENVVTYNRNIDEVVSAPMSQSGTKVLQSMRSRLKKSMNKSRTNNGSSCAKQMSPSDRFLSKLKIAFR